jgi:hypothetical protein
MLNSLYRRNAFSFSIRKNKPDIEYIVRRGGDIEAAHMARKLQCSPYFVPDNLYTAAHPFARHILKCYQTL